VRKTKTKAQALQSKTKPKTKGKPLAKAAKGPAKKAQLKAKPKQKPKAKAARNPKSLPADAKGPHPLWKLLKQKVERLKAAAQARSPNAMYNEQSRFQSQPRHDRFAKFAGPRRRAA
jgi:hypothetical protein